MSDADEIELNDEDDVQTTLANVRRHASVFNTTAQRVLCFAMLAATARVPQCHAARNALVWIRTCRLCRLIRVPLCSHAFW